MGSWSKGPGGREERPRRERCGARIEAAGRLRETCPSSLTPATLLPHPHPHPTALSPVTNPSQPPWVGHQRRRQGTAVSGQGSWLTFAMCGAA